MKKIFYLMAIFCLVLFITGCGKENVIEHKEKIVVGVNNYVPPMGFSDNNNQIVGFDIDLARLVASKLKSTVEFYPLKSKKTDALDNENVDILWNTLDLSSKDNNKIIFTKPYLLNRQIVFALENSSIKDLNDLNGKVVGIRKDSIAENDINKNLHLRKMFKKVIIYDNAKEEFNALQKGEIKAVIDSQIIGYYYLKENKTDIKPLDIFIGKPVPLSIAFKEKDTVLRDKVQTVLNELKEDGTLSKLSQKWFGKDIIAK